VSSLPCGAGDRGELAGTEGKLESTSRDLLTQWESRKTAAGLWERRRNPRFRMELPVELSCRRQLRWDRSFRKRSFAAFPRMCRGRGCG